MPPLFACAPILTNNKPPTAPNVADYSVELTPTPALLFHYSALTYNAHRIHLDRSYCREVEGHRDLLVHGPLSLTLMLSVLQSRLAGAGEFIDSIDYRHLAPLYVGQRMRICVARQKPRALATTKKSSSSNSNSNGGGDDAEKKEAQHLDDGDEKGNSNKWDVWIENQDGSLCVKGTAETAKAGNSQARTSAAGTPKS
jgi:acyl dehydratase